MPSFTINPKLSQGDSHSGARSKRGTRPQARSSGVTPGSDAETLIKDWSVIINNTPKSQIIEIVEKTIPEICGEGEKSSVSYLRGELISVLNESPKSETAVAIQQQITQAAHVLEHESQMTRDSMLKIVGIMDESAPGKFKNKDKADIFKWINNEFGQLAVGKKNAVLSNRNNILAQKYAEKAPNDAGTSKKMPTLKDIYGVDDEAPKKDAPEQARAKMTTPKKAAPSAQVANSKTTTKFDPTFLRLISESKKSIGDLLERICAMEELLR